MCERFYLTATPTEIKRQFKLDKAPELMPRYNIAPTQLSPIVISKGKGRELLVARWGLVPAWSRDLSLGAGMVNAPAETLEAKPAYRVALQSQRCLVLANGFYEWQTRGARKQPYKIAVRNGALIGFAGLWEQWTPETGEAAEHAEWALIRPSPSPGRRLRPGRPAERFRHQACRKCRSGRR